MSAYNETKVTAINDGVKASIEAKDVKSNEPQQRLMVKFPEEGNMFEAMALAMAVKAGKHYCYYASKEGKVKFLGVRKYNCSFKVYKERLIPIGYDKMYFGKNLKEGLDIQVWNGSYRVKGIKDMLVDTLSGIDDLSKRIFATVHEFNEKMLLVEKEVQEKALIEQEDTKVVNDEEKIHRNVIKYGLDKEVKCNYIFLVRKNSECHVFRDSSLSELDKLGLSKCVTGAYSRPLEFNEYRKYLISKKNRKLVIRRAKELDSLI